MLVPSRRNLIIGVGALVSAPALANAENLMKLRGYLLDPYVLILKPTKGIPFISLFNPRYDNINGIPMIGSSILSPLIRYKTCVCDRARILNEVDLKYKSESNLIAGHYKAIRVSQLAEEGVEGVEEVEGRKWHEYFSK